jgi:hypothetical protein
VKEITMKFGVFDPLDRRDVPLHRYYADRPELVALYDALASMLVTWQSTIPPRWTWRLHLRWVCRPLRSALAAEVRPPALHAAAVPLPFGWLKKSACSIP